MISDNFKENAYAQETNLALIMLLTLQSEEMTEDIRICNVPVEKLNNLGENVYGCESNGLQYVFLPFEIETPQDDNTGAVSAKLTIDNISREMVLYARSTKKPINVNISCVLSNDLNYVEFEYNDFKFVNISYDGFTVSGNLSIDYLALEPFPYGRFTPSGFPGLF